MSSLGPTEKSSRPPGLKVVEVGGWDLETKQLRTAGLATIHVSTLLPHIELCTRRSPLMEVMDTMMMIVLYHFFSCTIADGALASFGACPRWGRLKNRRGPHPQACRPSEKS